MKQPAVYDDEGELIVEEQLETDEQLRNRYWITWGALGMGTEDWYKFHALNADVGVKNVVAKNTGDAEVTVYIQSETGGGGVPTSALIQTVRDELTLKMRKVLNDTLIVTPVDTLAYTITGTVRIAAGASDTDTIDELKEAARLFAQEKENIGQFIPLSKIYQALAHPDVISLDLTSPMADIAAGDTVVPFLNALTIGL